MQTRRIAGDAGTFLVRATACLLGALLAAGAVAEPEQHGDGSHVLPLFSVQHEALLPDADTTLMACVTNANPHSSRAVDRGDLFRFQFLDGTLGACEDAMVVGAPSDMSDTDFTCTTSDRFVTLTHVGGRAAWPYGTATCAAVRYRSPARPTVVLPEMSVRNEGAFSEPTPGAIPIAVAAGLGHVGPVGATGAPGPRGAAGASGVVQSRLFRSTAATRAFPGFPEEVPGLTQDIDTVAGSRLVVHVDAHSHVGCYDFTGSGALPADLGVIDLQVDGATVASRVLNPSAPSGLGYNESQRVISWIGDSMAGGTHRLRVLVTNHGPGYPSTTHCVGDPAGTPTEARLLVLELRD